VVHPHKVHALHFVAEADVHGNFLREVELDPCGRVEEEAEAAEAVAGIKGVSYAHGQVGRGFIADKGGAEIGEQGDHCGRFTRVQAQAGAEADGEVGVDLHAIDYVEAQPVHAMRARTDLVPYIHNAPVVRPFAGRVGACALRHLSRLFRDLFHLGQFIHENAAVAGLYLERNVGHLFHDHAADDAAVLQVYHVLVIGLPEGACGDHGEQEQGNEFSHG